jgi:lysozyme family protein
MSEGTETAAVVEPVAAAAPAAPVAAPVAEPEALAPASLFEQLAARWIANAPKESKHGITRKMLGDYLNRKSPATPDELAGIDLETAKDILYRRYWLPIAGDKLPEPVAALIFDVAVRRGTEEAGKLLQAAAKRVEPMALKLDGRIGMQTLTAIDELVKAGKAVALEERVFAERTTAVFKLGDGKLFGRDLNLAVAARLAGTVAKAALAAKTGIRIP